MKRRKWYALPHNRRVSHPPEHCGNYVELKILSKLVLQHTITLICDQIYRRARNLNGIAQGVTDLTFRPYMKKQIKFCIIIFNSVSNISILI